MPERPEPSRAANVAARTPAAGSTVRVALAGLSNARMVSALHADERIELIAMGDADARTRRGVEERPGVPVYEDLRSMLLDSIRMGLDLLVVALPPHLSLDVVARAGRSEVAVLHTVPFARTVSEATELLRAFDDDGPRLLAPRPWHHEPAYAELSRWLDTISPIHAVTGAIATMETPVGWRGDSTRSGGGVLLHGAYDALDLMIEMLGVPERVHAEAVQCGTGQ